MRYRTLSRYLETFERAAIAEAWSGSLPPQEAEIVYQEYEAASKAMRYVLRMLAREPNNPKLLEPTPEQKGQPKPAIKYPLNDAKA